MFALGCRRRLATPLRRCASSAAPSRSIPSASLRRKSNEDDPDDAEGATATASADGDGTTTFPMFLRNNEKYKLATPHNWMTQKDDEPPESPFFTNPSFKPPAPISDQLRNRMYKQYMLDPEKNDIRALSQRNHLSLKRVEAILRLKGLEAAHVKGKQLQTGFLWGMEMLLGVRETTDEELIRGREPSLDPVDVHDADMLEQVENRDAARQRFQRQYWESVVDDGKEPLLPASLEHSRQLAIRSAERALKDKSNPRLMPRFKDTATIKSPRQKVQVVEMEGRLPVHFVDIGGRFIEVKERERRMVRSERRRAFKIGRRC
ncbi:eukaryotic mitochondrial regulator protein-domain-containing protein [Mycena amicta]|nr:eukaryotic mitochondrial regulator protein-domain-containing protein [Mycena amicta]